MQTKTCVYEPEDTLQIVKIQSKGPQLNTLERFHIYIRKARPAYY
jgi:hypothetical protein